MRDAHQTFFALVDHTKEGFAVSCRKQGYWYSVPN